MTQWDWTQRQTFLQKYSNDAMFVLASRLLSKMVRKKLNSWSRSFRAGAGATSLVPDDDERRDGEQTDEAAEGKHHHKIDIVVLDGDRVGRDGTGHHACKVHKQK